MVSRALFSGLVGRFFYRLTMYILVGVREKIVFSSGIIRVSALSAFLNAIFKSSGFSERIHFYLVIIVLVFDFLLAAHGIVKNLCEISVLACSFS